MSPSRPCASAETISPLEAERPGRWSVLPPQWLVVGVAVLFNYWFLRAEASPVAYLNDSSVHEQMVRFATARIEAGHLPQTSWFPYLGLGSPQFLHYQGLPATLTGLAGVVLGPNRAFAWSLYLILSLWPLSVYIGARAFRFSSWSAAMAALLSPLLISQVAIGFESIAYLWIGFGVWAQLWAMFTLPMAWGFSFQAITEGRRYFPAVLFVSLTVMFHFETGYLALAPLVLFVLLRPSAWRERTARATIVAVASLAATAWVTVPVVLSSNWASVNEILRGTPLENGYGARQVLEWLVNGGMLDAGRLPVVTLLALVGLVVSIIRCRRDDRSRALLVLLAMSLVLSFGRTTFGSLVDLLPGSTDIFMRRFMMGIQLASLFLAGIGLATLGSLVVRGFRRSVIRFTGQPLSGRWLRPVGISALVVVVVVALAPAWSQIAGRARENAHAVAAQQRADSEEGARLAPLVRIIRRDGGGRVYAGLPNNWGASFAVGNVPVFKYLESQDLDEVGYTLRTASLMTDPEYFFDEDNPGDYTTFGVRYLIEPTWKTPPVPARLLRRSWPYALWEVPSAGYIQVARVVGAVSADRANVGVRSIAYLRSTDPARGETLAITYPDLRPLASHDQGSGSAGTVLAQTAQLGQGRAQAVVRMHHRGVVILSASFDPGWRVLVDGRTAQTVMVAPALVGVQVGPGTHRILFTYGGYGSYPPFFVLGALALVGVILLDWRRRTGTAGGSSSARSRPGT